MKKITFLLCLLAVITNGCLSTPRWVTYRNVTAYVPPGFSHDVPYDGCMRIWIYGTSNCVILDKIAREETFQSELAKSIKSAQDHYGENNVKISKITTLGNLKGQGVKITMTDQVSKNVKEDETWFLTDKPNMWMVLAGCSSGSSGVWSSYEQILNSLTLQ